MFVKICSIYDYLQTSRRFSMFAKMCNVHKDFQCSRRFVMFAKICSVRDYLQTSQKFSVITKIFRLYLTTSTFIDPLHPQNPMLLPVHHLFDTNHGSRDNGFCAYQIRWLRMKINERRKQGSGSSTLNIEVRSCSLSFIINITIMYILTPSDVANNKTPHETNAHIVRVQKDLMNGRPTTINWFQTRL